MKKNTIHRLDGLNNRHLFLTIREAGKSKIEVLANWVLGRVFLACRWLLSHCVLAGQRECLSLFLFLKGHSSYHGDPTLMTSSTPNYLPCALPPNTILCLKASTCEFWVYINMQFVKGRNRGNQ